MWRVIIGIFIGLGLVGGLGFLGYHLLDYHLYRVRTAVQEARMEENCISSPDFYYSAVHRNNKHEVKLSCGFIGICVEEGLLHPEDIPEDLLYCVWGGKDHGIYQ